MAGSGTPGLGGDYSASEWGFPKPPAPPPGDKMPGGGGYSVPGFLSFSSLVRTAARTFLSTFDEALLNSPQNARAMWRDIVLWKAIRARQRPTAQLNWSIEPKDETDPAEIESAALVTEIIESIPRFQQMKVSLLNAIWFGKYAVEVDYQWQTWYGRQVMCVRDWIPINGDKIRYKWDHTPGILVNAIYPGEREYTDTGPCHFLYGREREQYVIHRHEPDDADYIDGQTAGSVMGVGLRGRLYWFWWLKQQVFALLMNYLERFSNGLTIFYYDAHNPAAKEEAEAAARSQFSNTALLYPRWMMGNSAPNGVERLEVGTASPILLWNLVSEYFDPTMTQAIVGQTLSSDHTGSGGLGGGGVAKFQSETLDEILAYDALDLQDTLQTDLVEVLYKYNCKGVRPGRFKFTVESPDSEAILGYAQQLFELGAGLDEDELFDLAKLTKPKPGSAILSKVGAMQAAAVAAAPQGVPMAGPAGLPSPDQSGQPPQQAVPGDLTGQATPAMAFRRGSKLRRSSRTQLPRRRLVRA